MGTAYTVLGLTRSSTKDEVRTAYLLKAMGVHPDKGGTVDAFMEVKKAYDNLQDNERRRRYDAWLDENFKLCPKCSGRGVKLHTKSFRERVVRPCANCKGSGVVE